MKKLALSTLVLAFALSANASTSAEVEAKFKQIDDKQSACLEEPDNYSTFGMLSCIADSNEALDKILNDEYKIITNKLKKKDVDQGTADQNKEVLERLVQAQRDWIKFRDSNILLAGLENFGGTLENLSIANKVGTMTKERILELLSMFEIVEQ